jgi:heme exporter protein C
MATVQRPPETPQTEYQTPATNHQPPTNIAWWKWVCGLMLAYVCIGAFYVVKGAAGFTGGAGDSARIIFFHVPSAILCSVAYFVAAYYAYRVLNRKAESDNDVKSATAMELGFLFCILATVTGSIFSEAQWGSYWNWDPRQVSIVPMLLLYAAYLSLRGAVPDNPIKRGRLSAVYIMVTLVPTIFLIWVVPRIPALQSLHPADTLINQAKTSGQYKMVLYPSFIAFGLLFTWMFQLRYRLVKLTMRREATRGYTNG